MGNKKKSLLGLAIASSLVAFGFFAYRPWGALDQLATYRFDSVEGRFIKLGLDGNGHFQRVEYSYVVGGRQLVSDRLSYLVDDWKWELYPFGEKKPGDRVTVYFDAASPDRCVLLQGFSDTAKFFGAWIGLACAGWVMCLYICLLFFRPKEEFSNQWRGRVEYVNGVPRIRMTPGNLTPLSAGFWCFLILGAFAYFAATFWFGLSARMALAPAITVGLACGAFDYWFTQRGNERGRWDLIVDTNRGVIQFPVLKAFGRPKVAFIADITGFTCNPIGLRDDEEYPHWALRAHVNEEGCPRSIVVFIARNTAELEALADWIRETAGLADASPTRVIPDEPISIFADI